MVVRLHSEAETDLDEVYLEGLRLFGPNQAAVYLRSLNVAFDRIAAQPYAYSERTEFDPPLRVCPHKSHLILYRVEGEDIVILRVRHGREDWLTIDPE